MRVRATQTGYYGHKRRKAGEQFELTPLKNKDGSVTSVEQQFSSKWMEAVEDAPNRSRPNVKGKKSQASEEDAQDQDVI